MQSTVAVIGFLKFPPERMSEARPHLKLLVEATQRVDGCIAYDVAEDLFDPGLIRFSELWPDQESLARHLQAPHMEPWRNFVGSCGLPERKFTVYDISNPRPL